MAVPQFTDSTVDAEGLLNAFELRSDETRSGSSRPLILGCAQDVLKM